MYKASYFLYMQIKNYYALRKSGILYLRIYLKFFRRSNVRLPVRSISEILEYDDLGTQSINQSNQIKIDHV